MRCEIEISGAIYKILGHTLLQNAAGGEIKPDQISISSRSFLGGIQTFKNLFQFKAGFASGKMERVVVCVV